VLRRYLTDPPVYHQYPTVPQNSPHETSAPGHLSAHVDCRTRTNSYYIAKEIRSRRLRPKPLCVSLSAGTNCLSTRSISERLHGGRWPASVRVKGKEKAEKVRDRERKVCGNLREIRRRKCPTGGLGGLPAGNAMGIIEPGCM
jgi:hypothetical protein